MIENNIILETSTNHLSGTLCLPGAAQYPIVLMIHGSGPLDRDENLKNMKLNIFNTIAHSLIKAGFASLRYDKRGCGKSSGNYWTSGHYDLVDDASAWIEHFKKHKNVDAKNIFILGHSEGTLIAAQLSIKHPDIAGIILLNPFIQNLRDILVQQALNFEHSVETLAGIKGRLFRLIIPRLINPVRIQKKFIAKIESSSEPTLRHFGARIPAKWAREGLAVNPRNIYQKVNSPLMIISGDKDIQCSHEDAIEICNTVQMECTHYLIKDLTHILRKDNDKPSIFHYKRLLKEPMSEDVLNHICDWLISFKNSKKMD